MLLSGHFRRVERFAYEGLDYAEPTYREGLRYAMTVHADVQMGCVCADQH
jgi:hypothetical protein